MDALNKQEADGVLTRKASEPRGETKSKVHEHGTEPCDGRLTCGGFIGTGLRHARRAAELNLQSGPRRRVAESLKRAREAFESAEWMCDYAEGER